MESREVEHSTDVRHPTWNPWLKLDGAALPWNSSIREFQRGHSYHVAEALEHPPSPQGYGCFKTHEATRVLLVPKEGLGHGEFYGIPY